LTLNTIVQGAWALLLSRYSGRADVVFGVTVAGRPAELAGVESMIGLFINTLPVRVRVAEEEALLPWLRDLQARQVEMRQYEHSPLVQVQGWSEVPRGQPLFESILVFENYPMDASLRPWAGRLGVESVRSQERTNYALTLAVIPGAEYLLRILYDTRLFDAVAIGRLLGHVRILLEGIAAGPGQLLADLPLLTGAESEQLLRQWNDTEVSPAPHPEGVGGVLPDLDRLTDEELDTWIHLLQEPTGGTCREPGPGSDLQPLA
jgi:non-ribosomal peptide synthetase component F